MQKIEYNNASWLNFPKPTTDDLLFLKNNFHLAASVLNELSIPVKRPKAEEYDSYIFLVLHFPVFDPKTRKTTPTEIDFIITKDCLITVYQEPITMLELFFADCTNQGQSREEYFKDTGYLLFCILDKLTDSCLPMLDHIHDHIEDIENNIFRGKEKEMITEVAIVKRDIIDFRRTLKPQRSVLEIISQKASRFFSRDLDYISQEVIGSNTRVWNTLENHKEMIEAIEETNNSLFSYKISEIIKVLTVLSLITFPLNLINGFLGMSLFGNVPFMQASNTYLFVLAAELIIALALLLFFKKKKWI